MLLLESEFRPVPRSEARGSWVFEFRGSTGRSFPEGSVLTFCPGKGLGGGAAVASGDMLRRRMISLRIAAIWAGRLKLGSTRNFVAGLVSSGLGLAVREPGIAPWSRVGALSNGVRSRPVARLPWIGGELVDLVLLVSSVVGGAEVGSSCKSAVSSSTKTDMPSVTVSSAEIQTRSPSRSPV